MSFNAPAEDCRDFLRTGRCKYGMSCKYNHPSNVLNGGGIKPSDPSELLFPIRPNEPVCDYYMKHRTCKFGSACKFNHPPLNAAGTYINGMMTPPPLTPRRAEPAVQLLLSPVGTEATANGQVMMMQYLPQRPGEPDCIYFLKNRSCKYGATCRYHHPVLSQRPKQRPHQDAFSMSSNNGRGGQQQQQQQRVQYVTQVIPSYTSHQGQVLLSAESSAPVTFITVDGTSAQGYLVTGDVGHQPAYCIPAGSVGFTEQSSSASSVGSSLETSNGDFLGDHTRIRRNTSVGSFNSEVRQQQQQQQQGSYLPHSISEGNIVQRRARAASFGSAATDGSQPPTAQHYEAQSGLSWSQRARGGSFGSRQDYQGQQQQQQQYHYGSNSAMPRHRSTGNIAGRARANHGPDEGFTRMTSVLLNMLDTPEEAASECVSDEDTPNSYNRVRPLRGSADSADASAMLARLHLTPIHNNESDVPQEIIRTATSQNDLDGDDEEQQHHRSAFLRSLSGGRDFEATTASLRNGLTTSWFPSWTGSTGDDSEMFSMLHQTHQPSNNSSQSQKGHGSSDIGMYLS